MCVNGWVWRPFSCTLSLSSRVSCDHSCLFFQPCAFWLVLISCHGVHNATYWPGLARNIKLKQQIKLPISWFHAQINRMFQSHYSSRSNITGLCAQKGSRDSLQPGVNKRGLGELIATLFPFFSSVPDLLFMFSSCSTQSEMLWTFLPGTAVNMLLILHSVGSSSPWQPTLTVLKGSYCSTCR